MSNLSGGKSNHRLPKTGDEQQAMYIGLGGLLMGAALLAKKRRQDEEND